MKNYVSRILATVLSVTMCLALFAQTPSSPISKDKLIALKNAGINDAVLIQQIQKDGISFEMNADTTLELKSAGFSNEVLQALLQASKNGNANSTQPVRNDNVAALYKAGKFPELADTLKATINSNPTDYRSRALLVMTSLKMKENDAAHAEFEQLASHEQDAAAAPIVKQVRGLLDTLAKNEEAKSKLLAALKDYRTADAYTAVDQLSASPIQKELLKIDLDMYQARFDEARDRFSTIQFSSYAEKDRSSKVRDHITETAAVYKKLMSRIDVYLYSPLTPAVCRFPLSSTAYNAPEVAALSVKEYVDVVNTLMQLSPLNDVVRNLSVHAQMLTGNYEQLEIVGDQLLKTNGTIRIPFYAADRFFHLVIDDPKKHIYTEDDPHHFDYISTNKWVAAKKDWLTEIVPFDLSFDQIKGISQKAESFHHLDGLDKKPYALKFEPTGVAPNYALMDILFCSVGEKAELTVTRNLGRYIIHVIGNNNIKAELADPSKATGPSSDWTTAALMLGGALAASGRSSPLNQMAVQALQSEQAQQAATFQSQQAAWESFTAARDTFNLMEADAFGGLEQLLGVLN